MHFAHLISLHPDVPEKEYLLQQDSCTIGRLAEVCDLQINRPTVSRIHARVERQGSHYVIINLSRNNTFINGTPINGSYILTDRDVIGFSSPEPLLRFVDFDPTVAITGRLIWDPAAMQFRLDGIPVELTPSQNKLLYYLYQHVGEVCSREKCEEAVWGADPVIEPSALHRLIADLRTEMRRAAPDADLLETRRGVGYVLKTG